MPPVPKSPTQKKNGAPKAKGAVRAKSGCYTCRIRRKKCDERPNSMNACETCVRLRLECLGFGAKRPDWLRESSKVSDLREKIKSFLASQGMIKGHSGSGPRGTDNEPVILRLNEQDYSSSSESPQSNILTLSSSAEDFRPIHHTSSIRDEQNWTSTAYVHSTHSPPQLRHSPSPYASYNSSDLPYTFEPNNASNSLVPWTASSPSSFGPLYNVSIVDDTVDYNIDDATYPTPGFPTFIVPDELLEHYKKNVVGLQYLLLDKYKFPNIIFTTVDSEGFSREGARLLAQIDLIRNRTPQQLALQSDDVKKKLAALRNLLSQHSFNDNDAMASLHVVSSFLFDGGAGDWEEWLNVACSYCESLLSQYNGIINALLSCGDQSRFLIKTAIWFEVLASVTTLKSPRLLLAVRDFCGPNVSGVYDPGMPAPPELSMMPIMGCENSVIWALAETSALAAWKHTQERKGCLSMPELVSKGTEIGRYLGSSPLPQHPSMMTDELDIMRRSTAEIFHASARIYLASVVSGDHISVPEISDAVADLIRCVQRIPSDPNARNAIIRSTVFSFFICGCFTDNQAYRRIISEHLGAGGGPGNCRSVKEMLEEVWVSRASKKRSEPVQWRQMLHSKRLLLV